uniref:Uncharacterized protein n=1 Tax=Oryza brachyantha TaxID=4533 RepID=J3LS00_ORYBR
MKGLNGLPIPNMYTSSSSDLKIWTGHGLMGKVNIETPTTKVKSETPMSNNVNGDNVIHNAEALSAMTKGIERAHDRFRSSSFLGLLRRLAVGQPNAMPPLSGPIN